MSLVNDGSNMVMPVGPMNGYGNSYGMGINPAPIPSYTVQNPYCCQNQNFGCGCGM